MPDACFLGPMQLSLGNYLTTHFRVCHSAFPFHDQDGIKRADTWPFSWPCVAPPQGLQIKGKVATCASQSRWISCCA